MDTNVNDSTEIYLAKVKEAAEAKRNENIPNSTMDHAEIGVRFLFQNAEVGSIMYIVSDEFFDEFWGRLKNVITDFLKKTGKLEVILLKKKNRLIDELQKEHGEQVKTFIINENVSQKEKIPHIVIASPVGYRVELSDELMKEKIVKGVLNFGDESGTNNLRNFFFRLRSLSVEATYKEISPMV